MKFTILGCGTSTGVPVPACDCAVCQSSNPKNNRTRTSGLITLDDGRTIVIDTGPDFRFQALRENVKRVDAVLYTHAHADHVLGMEDLRGYNFIHRTAVDCFATADTGAALRRIFHYIFEPPAHYQGGHLAQVVLHEIQHGQSFTAVELPITPFQLWHGKFSVTGYKFGPLAYATDCKLIPDESKELIRGSKYLILDGLRFRDHSTHFTIDEAVSLAQELEVEQCYLIHMSHDVDYESCSKDLPQGVALAYDGLQIDLAGD